MSIGEGPYLIMTVAFWTATILAIVTTITDQLDYAILFLLWAVYLQNVQRTKRNIDE